MKHLSASLQPGKHTGKCELWDAGGTEWNSFCTFDICSFEISIITHQLSAGTFLLFLFVCLVKKQSYFMSSAAQEQGWSAQGVCISMAKIAGLWS